MKTAEWLEIFAGILLIALEQAVRRQYGAVGLVVVIGLSIGLRVVKAPHGSVLVAVFVLLMLQA